MPWLLPVSTLLGGVGIALSGLGGSYALTLVFVAVLGIGVAAYHPESARVARLAGQGGHRAMGWISSGGNIGFAPAPLMVAAVVAPGRGIALGLTASIGGLASPVIGALADASSLQTALAPLVVMPLLSRVLFRGLPEPTAPHPGTAPEPQVAGAEAAPQSGNR